MTSAKSSIINSPPTTERNIRRPCSGLLETTSRTISINHAKPILCTIPPSSIHNWNHTRLRQHKTALLKHCKQYPTMQENMISSLLIINKSHGTYTPKLADAIITKSGGENHRVHYSRLVDGVHLTQSVKEEWANMILQAIDKNRSSFTPSRMKSIPSPPSSDSDSDSDPEPDHQRKKRK